MAYRFKMKKKQFANDMIVYIDNNRKCTKINSELISDFGKVTGYKMTTKNHITYYIMIY